MKMLFEGKMNKAEWCRHWREERIRERALRHERYLKYKSCRTFAFSALRELYDYQYLPKEDVFINLINRYKDKLTPDYIENAARIIETWKPAARERSKELLKNLIYYGNPLLSMIKKSDIPVP